MAGRCLLILTCLTSLGAVAGCPKKAPDTATSTESPEPGVTATKAPAPVGPVAPAAPEKPAPLATPRAEALPPGAIDCERVCGKPIECAKTVGATPEGAASADLAKPACLEGCESAVKANLEGSLEPLRVQSRCADAACADYGRCVADGMRGSGPEAEPAPEKD